jgi:hypothetical protein
MMLGLAPWSRDGSWCFFGNGHCVECGSHDRTQVTEFGVDHTRVNRQGAIGLFICRACAILHHYPDFLPSLFTWAYGEDFNA